MRGYLATTFILVATMAVGCSSGGPSPKTEGVSTNAQSNEDRAALHATCWQRFNDRVWNDVASCYANPATSGALGGVITAGEPQKIIEQGAKVQLTAFPNGTGEPQLTLVNGPHIVSIVLLRGKHTAPWVSPMGSIPPTGKNVGFLGLQKAEMDRGGRIEQEWWVIDPSVVMGQLGLSPTPTRPVMEQGFAKKIVLVAKNDETEDKNIQATRRLYELFGAQDKRMFDYFADDVVDKNPMNPEDTVGHANVETNNRAFWKGFSDIHVDIDELWAAEDHTIMVAHIRGTNDGDMPSMGLTKSGKKLDMIFAEIAQWKDGKIQVAYPFANTFEMATQLGLVPQAQ